jgi:carbon starvation protein CstA
VLLLLLLLLPICNVAIILFNLNTNTKMHWTTLVPLVLSVVHTLVAAHNRKHYDDALLFAARNVSLVLIVEVCSNCDMYVVSVLLATYAIVVLVINICYEVLHVYKTQKAKRAHKKMFQH